MKVGSRKRYILVSMKGYAVSVVIGLLATLF